MEIHYPPIIVLQNESEREVLELFIKEETLDTSTIRDTLNMSRATAYRAVNRLREKQLIRKIGTFRKSEKGGRHTRLWKLDIGEDEQ